MPLINVKLGDKNLYNQIDHLFEDYAALVSGSSFPKHAALKFEGTKDNYTCYIVNAAEKDEHIEEFTHSKIKCATIVGWGEAFVSAKAAALGTATSPSGLVACPLIKYLVVFTDGRQAIITARLAESQLAIERILF